jgi:hypothetical protein
MPRRVKKPVEFGPRPLLGEAAARFVDKFEIPAGVLAKGETEAQRRADYHAAAMPLVRLVLWPHEMGDPDTATWFPRFYAAHPDFTAAFLAAMRAKARGLTPAEHYLRSFAHLAEGREIDDGTRARKVEKMTGQRVTVESFGTARAKKSMRKQ